MAGRRLDPLLFWSLGLMIAFGGCSSPSNVTPPGLEDEEVAELEVGENGGSVALKGTVLTIPPGAVPAGTTVKVVETTSETVEGYQVAGRVFRFEPAGLRFSPPASILFPLTAELRNATVFWSNEDGGFSPLLAQRTTEGLVAEVHHFSLGFVGSPDDPACEDVVCAPRQDPYCDPARPAVAIREFLPVCHEGACEAPRTEVDCSSAANATGTCEAGVCVVASCHAGFDDCDGESSNGCETDLAASVAHCGACGVVCEAGVACVEGACDGGAVATVPGSPSSVVATAGVRAATVTWTAPEIDGGSPITHYLVRSPEAASVSVQVSETTAVVAEIESGVAYTFIVTAVNAVGQGPASAPSNAVTPTAPLSPPTAPSDVVAVAGDRAATVIWTAPDSDGGSPITGYVVLSSPGAVRVETTQTTALVTGLDNGVAYTFTVTALNAVGEGPASLPSAGVTPVAPAIAPGVPTNVVALAGDTTASVSWTAPFDDGGSPIIGYFINVSDGRELFVVGTSVTVEGLTNGVEYTFTVRAATDEAEGPASENSNPIIPASIGPTVTAPGAPTAVSAVAGNQSAVVSWVAPAADGGSPVVGYTIVASSGASTFAPSSPATITGLQNGVAYTFTVSAANAVGQSAPSAPSSEITPAGLPGIVRDLVATAGDETASVTWTAPEDDGGSDLIGYSIVSSSGESRFVAAPPAVFDGLTNDQTYTFVVYAVNGIGKGPARTSEGVVPTETTLPPTIPGAPLQVDAVAGDGSATVTWSPPSSDGGSPILSYKISSVPAGAAATADGDATSTTIEGLTNGMAYAFVVVASNAQGDGPSSALSSEVVPTEEVPPASPPSAPRNVVATRGNAKATVTWDLPSTNGGSPITGYEVTASDGSVRHADRSPLDFDGLDNGAAYTFTVVAINAAGDSDASAPSNVVTPATVPDAPTGVFATAGDGQATVSWVAPGSDGGSALIGFLVETVGGSSRFVAASLRSTVIDALDNGTHYRFTVRALNGIGQGPASAPSNEVTPEEAQAPATKPGAPTQVEAVAATNAATVSWLAPADDGGSPLLGYYVETGADSRFTASSPYAFSDLSSDSEYVFTVSAVNVVGRGPASAPSKAITPNRPLTAPMPPTQVVATLGGDGVTVSWTPPADDGGSPIVGYRVTPDQGETRFVTGTFATFTNLVPGTSYTFIVKAVNAQGESAPSAPSTATIWTTPPGAPLSVQASPLDASALVTWSPPASDGGAAISGYRLTASPGGAQATVEGDVLEALVTGLANGTAYTFTVTATNERGTSPASAPSSPVTPEAEGPQITPPGTPGSVQASPLDARALVTWTAPASDGGAAISAYTVTASPGGAQATVHGGALEAVVTGLANGTAYTFTVTATNERGVGAASEPSNAVVPEAPPGATPPTRPLNVSAVAGPERVTVTWDAPQSDGGSAILHYTVAEERGGVAPFQTQDDSARVATITGLRPQQPYRFFVTATNGVGESQPSMTTAPVYPTEDLSVPRSVQAQAGDGSATVSWIPVQGHQEDYLVTVIPGGRTVRTPTSPVVIDALTNGVTYQFTVRTTGIAGDGPESAPSNAVTPKEAVPVTLPGAPRDVFAFAGPASALVVWTAPEDDGGDEIAEYRVTSDPPDAEIWVTGWETSAIVEGLSPGVSYTFQVTARNAAGLGEESTPSDPVTPDEALPTETIPWAPTGVSAVAGIESATVTWTEPFNDGGSAITGYIVTSYPAGGSATVSGTERSATVEGLQAGTSYAFRVSAVNAIGASMESAPSNTVRTPTTPDAPSNLQATAVPGHVALSWAPPTDDGGLALTGYLISSHPAGASVVAAAEATSAQVSGLVAGQSYTFTVQARNPLGDSVASEPSNAVTFLRLEGVPGAPGSVVATAGFQSAIVTWEAPEDDGGQPILEYIIESQPSIPEQVVDAAQRAVTVTGLPTGVARTFSVKARNVHGRGAAGLSATVTPATTPGAPTGVNAIAGDGEATVSWIPPASNGWSPVTSYTVTSSREGPTAVVTEAPWRVTLPGLVNGYSYTFTVRATNAIGDGPESAKSAAVTPLPPSPPYAPQNVVAEPGDREVTLSWTQTYEGSFPVEFFTITASPGGATWQASASSRRYVAKGLTNGTSYTFTMTATNSVGPSNTSDPTYPVVPFGLADAPTNVSAIPGNQSATVSWTAPENDGGLPVTYFVTSSPGGRMGSASGGATTATVQGLTNGVSYVFTVQGQNGLGSGADSAPSTPVTPMGPPSQPLYLTTSPGDGFVTLTWEPPNSGGGGTILGYTVTASPGDLEVETDTTTVTMGGLTNGQTYTFTVAARNALSVGAVATKSSPVGPRPGKPGLAYVSVEDGVMLTLTWTEPTDLGPYPVSYVIRGPASNDVRQVDGATRTIAIDLLESAESYSVSIAAVSVVGEGEALEVTAFPGALPNVVAVPGFQSVSVTWGEPGAEYGAIVDYLVTLNPGGLTQAVTSRAASFTGLTNGEAYTATVQARNAQGVGPSGMSAPVRPADVPGAPRNVTSNASGQNDAYSLQVNWEAPEGDGGQQVTSYVVTLSPGGETRVAYPQNPSAWFNVSPRTTYTYTVVARNVIGEGAAASGSRFVAAVPGVPRDVTVTRGAGTLTVSWAPPTDDGGSPVTGYQVGSVEGYLFGSTESSSYTFTVIPGQVRSFVVAARNEVGFGPLSDATAPATSIGVPGAPGSVSVTTLRAKNGSADARVTWAPPSNTNGGLDKYTVTATWEGGSRVVDVTGAPPAITVDMADLPAVTRIDFAVTASNVAGASNAATATTYLFTQAGAPEVDVLSGDKQLTVSYTAPEEDGGAPSVTYQIVVKKTDGTTVRTQNWLESPLEVTGLLNGTTYSVEVRVIAPISGVFSQPVLATPCSDTVNCRSPGKLPAPVSVKQTSGVSNVWTVDTATAANGDTVVTGTFWGRMELESTYGRIVMTTPEDSVSPDMFVTYYEANGNVRWAYQGTSVGRDTGYSVAIHPTTGDVYVAGMSNGSTVFRGEAVTQRGPFVARIAASGAYGWIQSLGITQHAGPQYAGSFAEGTAASYNNDAGAVYVAVNASGQVAVAAGMETSLDGIVVARLDPATGADLWRQTAGGNGQDLPAGVAIDDLGNVIVTGLFTNSARFGSGQSDQVTLTGHATASPFVARYDATGNLQWAHRADPDTAPLLKASTGKDVVVDPLGNIFLTGCIGSTTVAGPVDAFVASFDNAGTRRWFTRAGGTGLDCGYHLVLDRRGGLLVTGDFKGEATFGQAPSQHVIESAGGVDMFVARYTTEGELDWVEGVGSEADDSAGGIGFATSTGEFRLSGMFGYAPMMIGFTPLAPNGQVNSFLARFAYLP